MSLPQKRHCKDTDFFNNKHLKRLQMKSLYKALIERIEENKPQFLNKDLTPPVTIDLYNGQPEAAEFSDFLTPALFFDYSISWEHGNKEYKAGKILLDIHVLIDPLPSAANYSERQTDGLKKIEYYDFVAQIVEELRTDTAGTLVLIGEQPRPIDFYNYHVLHFCGTIKKSDRRKLKKIPANPKINLYAG